MLHLPHVFRGLDSYTNINTATHTTTLFCLIEPRHPVSKFCPLERLRSLLQPLGDVGQLFHTCLELVQGGEIVQHGGYFLHHVVYYHYVELEVSIRHLVCVCVCVCVCVAALSFLITESSFYMVGKYTLSTYTAQTMVSAIDNSLL